jgi:hypothetical protein
LKSLQNRSIVKRLYEIALKEYKEKRPSEIAGYRLKLSVLLQRGLGPGLILSGLKGQAVPYLLVANYGDHYRLYYILEDGRMLNADNVPTPEFDREQLKFQKATTKLFVIPKPEVPESKIEKVKKQLNEKFRYYIDLIEKQTFAKVRNIPVITIYQTSIDEKLVIRREADFIKFPLELVTHKLIEGFLITEAYRLIFPQFVQKTKHMRSLWNIGAYFLLAKTLKEEWLNYWESKEPLRERTTQINEALFHAFVHFLTYLGKFETTTFEDEQFEKIFSIFSKISKKTDSNPEIAAQCYLQLANHEGNFILKAALYFILAKQIDDAVKILKELAKFAVPEEIQKAKTVCEELATGQLSKLYSPSFETVSFPLDIQKLFNEAFEQVKTRVLEINRIHKEKGKLNDPFTIKIEIRNKTDLTFQHLILKDELPSKPTIDFLSSNSFNLPQISPHQIISVEYQINCAIPAKLRLDNGSITFEDLYEHRYIQNLLSTVVSFI